MRIIVDAFGGDNAPDAIIKGAAEAVAAYGHTVVLTGDETTLRARFEALHLPTDGIEFLHADSVMDMHEEPRHILKEQRGSSMAVGLTAVAEGKGDAFVSAGSTGALLMGATFLVKRVKGVSRPALAPLMPGEKGPVMLIDCGANAECRPDMLAQFAHMGSIYYTRVLNAGKPARVGLINIGTEETKGGELQLKTYALLKDSDLNFVGNVEARELLSGEADVLVTDGFTGNVILKLAEGVARQLLSRVKAVFLTNWCTKLAALIVKPHLGTLKQSMDTSEFGGAPLLGVKKPVVKAHGNADANMIKNAIRVAAAFAEADVIGTLEQALAESAAGGVPDGI